MGDPGVDRPFSFDYPPPSDSQSQFDRPSQIGKRSTGLESTPSEFRGIDC